MKERHAIIPAQPDFYAVFPVFTGDKWQLSREAILAWDCGVEPQVDDLFPVRTAFPITMFADTDLLDKKGLLAVEFPGGWLMWGAKNSGDAHAFLQYLIDKRRIAAI